ncbi:MAG TPA: urate hydroxylase PuuD [Terriglobales bacterium]
MPEHTGTETLAIVLRWVHFLAGILWIGLLYFFNLVNVPFMKQVDAAMKPKVFQHLTLPALWLFRWSAVLTVFVGFWYWAQVYVAADARLTGASPWGAIGLFLLVWIVAFAIYFPILLKTPNPWALALVVIVLLSAAGWVFVNYTPVGGDDNHVLSIGIGGGLGLFMMLNVWGIIWRNNKQIIHGTLAGTPPANAATLARQAFLASRTNFYLSIPMLFFMGASYHYPILGK